MGGWGRPKNASNGVWIDYSDGKGSGGKAAGGWGGQRPWQNCEDSRGAKDPRPKEEKPAFLKAWTAAQTKKLDVSLAAMKKASGLNGEVPAKKQDGKDTKWTCPCGFVNFGFRLLCKDCEQPRSGASPCVGGAPIPGAMEVDNGSAKAESPEQEW